ncbi:MAG: hypothetical protein JNL10_20140 [Verrucomicrobiales bacterium]|nr:hypothetical protein [Verrucomicrobiales bacterium]
MNSHSLVTIHPYFQIKPGQRESALALLPAFVERTRTEAGCRFYEFTVNGDLVFCREGYNTAEDALSHLANVGDLLQKMLTVSDLARLEIHGPAAELDRLRGPVAPYGASWFVRECGFLR